MVPTSQIRENQNSKDQAKQYKFNSGASKYKEIKMHATDITKTAQNREKWKRFAPVACTDLLT